MGLKLYTVCQRTSRVMRWSGRLIVGAGRNCAAWLYKNGKKGNFDLSLIDEVFGILFGITLASALIAAEWGQSFDVGVAKILVVPCLMLVLLLIAINRESFFDRAAWFAAALVVAFFNIQYLMWLSRYDLKPEINKLQLLPISIMAWISIREVANLVLNILNHRRKS